MAQPLVALMGRDFNPVKAFNEGRDAAQSARLKDLMMQSQQQQMQYAQQDRDAAAAASQDAMRQKVLGNAFKALNDPNMTPPEKRAEAWQAVNSQLQSRFGYGLGADQYSDDAMRNLGIEVGGIGQQNDGVNYGLQPRVSYNEKTGRYEQYVQGSDGSTKWLGIGPDAQFIKMTLPDGREVLRDHYTGQVVDALTGQVLTPGQGAAQPTQGETSIPHGQPPQDGRPVTAPSDIFDDAERRAMEKMRKEKAIEAEATASKKDAELAQAASAAIPVVDELLSLTQSKYYTGTIADRISRGLAAQGMAPDDAAAANTQKVRLLAQRLSFQGKPPGLGQVTEGEWARITQAVGDPDLPPEQYRAALETLKKMLVQATASGQQSSADSSLDDLINKYAGQ